MWGPAFIETRLKWRKTQPLTVMELRVWRLAKPLQLAMKEEYFGCFSWGELELELQQLPQFCPVWLQPPAPSRGAAVPNAFLWLHGCAMVWCPVHAYLQACACVRAHARECMRPAERRARLPDPYRVSMHMWADAMAFASATLSHMYRRLWI